MAGLLVVALQVAVPEPRAGATAPSTAISVDRIGRGLEQPEHLLIPPPPPPVDNTPTFRVRIEGPPLETPLDVVRRELATQPYPERSEIGLPGIRRTSGGTDVLPAIMGAVRKVQRARYEAAERRIHTEVSEELDAFCAVNDCAQVNEGLLLPAH